MRLNEFIEKIKLNVKNEHLKKLYNISDVVKFSLSAEQISENTLFYTYELIDNLFKIICNDIKYFTALKVIEELDFSGQDLCSLKSLYKLLCYNGVICNELFEEIFPNLYCEIVVLIEEFLKNKICTVCIENPDLYGSEFYIPCNNCFVSNLINVYNLFMPRDFNDLEKIVDKLKANLQTFIDDKNLSEENRNMLANYLKEINEYLKDMK